VVPSPTAYAEGVDYFGNRVSRFSIEEPHAALEVTAASEVTVSPPDPVPDLGSSPAWEAALASSLLAEGSAAIDARALALESPLITAVPALERYARPSFPAGRPLLAAVAELMGRIHGEFTYDPHFTTVATPLAEVLEHRRGVCQDFAHLAIGCLRSIGLPARYVSGYIETLPPPGRPRMVGADASHAWFAVHVPGGGWVDFDPTNNQLPSDQHITVAWGRDYGDVNPLKGVVLGGGKHKLQVSVDVARSAGSVEGGERSNQPP
jgi:transglutaminase-like putative cysteine protease